MTQREIAAADELWESAAGALPVFSPQEQRAGVVLLRELAKGEPVTLDRLAQALGMSVEATEVLARDSALRPYIQTDEAGRIQRFYGLSVVPTRHKLTVNGRTLWTWCAEDALFMPELLGATAEIESPDPETGQSIRLTMSAERVEAVEPSGVVVSMRRPETVDATSVARIMASACHYILFFASQSSGEQWQAGKPGKQTVLLPLDVAIDFARRSNAHLFGGELAQRRRAN